MVKTIEVAICTWNRAAMLEATVDSIFKTTLPAGWKRRILIVDNNSTDGTSQLIQSLRESSLEIVPLYEPVLGHTHARNRAVDNLQGELVVWTDDDVLVPSQWLEAYIRRAESHAHESFWGAAIEPVFVGGKPAWIEKNWPAVSGCFAARDLGIDSHTFTKECLPYGANFALRTDMQKKYRFDTELGRQEDRVLGEDELEMMRRLLADGHVGSWVPNNPVQHLIPESRASTEYVWRYFVGQGERLGRAEHGSTWKQWVLAKWYAMRYRLTQNTTPSPAWFAHLANWGLAQGRLNALRKKSGKT